MRPRALPTLIVVFAALVLTGCHQDMWVQPKAKSQSKSDVLFTDGSNTRGVVAGTVAFKQAKTDREFHTGFDRSGNLVKVFPMAVTEEAMKRGQDRFRVFCVPCHGELGNGQGMIAKRGYTLARPVGNYHTQRLRDMPVGHFFDVITNGYGTMFPFRARIKPEDRWAIVAYVRALQESQYTPISSIPAEERAKLESMAQADDQNAASELPIGAAPDRSQNVPGGAVPPGTRVVPIGRQDRAPGTGAVPTTPDGQGTARPGGQPQ